MASIGLNVNSTAVIIGAMLISPLMGPIMGIGYGVGINDFEGTAEGSYESLDDFLKIMSLPEVAQRALEDEKKFIDHSRSSIGLYHVAWRTTI